MHALVKHQLIVVRTRLGVGGAKVDDSLVNLRACQVAMSTVRSDTRMSCVGCVSRRYARQRADLLLFPSLVVDIVRRPFFLGLVACVQHLLLLLTIQATFFVFIVWWCSRDNRIAPHQ